MSLSGRRPTRFEARVHAALGEVPRGRVVTYAEVAKRLGCRSAQAIGQALKRNPRAPEVPCHRVIRSDGRLGGYAGKRGGVRVDRKRRLLREEGVEFDDEGKLTDPERLWRWGG